MKKLTYSSMAAARLRANKRQYISLVLGIFLSIFLISTLVLSVYGICQAELQKRYDKVGFLDFVILDNDSITDEDLQSFDEFDRFGHAYISGIVSDRNVYVGYYDEVGLSLMNLKPISGRLPQTAGEIALEQSAMDVLEADWQLGGVVELAITPVDGVEETRSFTVVGILPERSAYLNIIDHNGLNQFPAILTSSKESSFTVGRLGVHYLMGLSPYATLNQAIRSFWEAYHGNKIASGVMNSFFGLSITGEQQMFYGTGTALDVDREMFTLILMAFVLAGSLILSCGIGISGAMEGVLSKRREEIGVLRALGATRRQIRRMFGRENLLIAAVVSPLSILGSIGAAWLLSIALPGSLAFAVNLWLLLPIVLFSVVVILISGYLPLVRASKLMPMSVIRDTTMLRRSKGVKSRTEFSPTRLMASRQVRFNPTRQIGAIFLVAFMLLGSGMLGTLVYTYSDYTWKNQNAFSVNQSYGATSKDGVNLYDKDGLSKQSIQQIRTLDHVHSILIDRKMDIIVQLDKVPQYAKLLGRTDQLGMLSDAMFEQAISGRTDREFYEGLREQYQDDYQQLRKTYGFEGEAFQMSIITMDLTKENVRILEEYLTEGVVNVDAINAGTQVLVLAPEMWFVSYENGGNITFTQDAPYFEEYVKEGAVLMAENDAFRSGQILPVTQLYSEDEEFTTIHRNDVQVQVCGIVDSFGDMPYSGRDNCVLITTEQGLENMGLRMEGLRCVDVYLKGELSLEDEARLERQLNAIARRNEGYTVYNWAENYRERQQARQQEIILYASVVTVFFAVAVGMIVSAVTRQLNSEGHTIGMLRVVGADEKAILGCYSGQLNSGILGGVAISLGLLGLYVIAALIDGLRYHYTMTQQDKILCVMMAIIICTMAFLCYVICKFLLRFRIREIVNKSIIDNIREL